MDENKVTPDNNMDEFDEVLEIMKKRRTTSEPKANPDSTAKAESGDSKTSNSSLTDTVIIPVSKTKAETDSKTSDSNSDTNISAGSDGNNNKTVEVDTTTIAKHTNDSGSVDATRIDMTPIKKTPGGANGVPQKTDRAVSLDDFNSTAPMPKTNNGKIKVTFLGSVWFGIIKIILYLAAVIAIACGIAATVIYIGNDIFAFVKESEITAKIPAEAGPSDIAVILEENEILSDIGDTKLDIDVVKNSAVKLSDILNTTRVLQPLRDAGITKISITDNSKFTITVPKNVDVSVVADLLETVDARKITTDLQILINIPEGATTKDVSKILEKAGVIKYSGVFNSYAKYRIDKRSYLTGEYIPGDHILNPMMNYDKLLDTLSAYDRDVSGTVRITIPEGLTVDETLELLESKGVGKKEDYTEALQNFEYEYKFAEGLNKDVLSEHRFNTEISYRLEGYLFPDTYDFYLNENPISALDKFLSNFNRKFEEEYYERAKEIGMTVDEIITLASMIEKEGNNPNDYYYISSVFHNRLNSSEFPYLNSDATLQYALTERSDAYNIDTSMVHPYNTYNNRGLPPGPICNPGIQAIDAALYPERTSYYYFYTKKNGETVFTRTYNEHQRVVNADKSN